MSEGWDITVASFPYPPPFSRTFHRHRGQSASHVITSSLFLFRTGHCLGRSGKTFMGSLVLRQFPNFTDQLHDGHFVHHGLLASCEHAMFKVKGTAAGFVVSCADALKVVLKGSHKVFIQGLFHHLKAVFPSLQSKRRKQYQFPFFFSNTYIYFLVKLLRDYSSMDINKCQLFQTSGLVNFIST